MITNLLTALKKAGVRARPYHRAPFGENIFALSIDRDHPKGTIKVYQGNAKVTAYPSRKHKQIACTVHEGNRMITRTVRRTITQDDQPARLHIINVLKRNFPVIMPAGTNWRVRNVKCEKKQERIYPMNPDNHDTIIVWRCSADITASVNNNTTNHFLIGMDEMHNFISPLPEEPKSVAHAHRMLRPKLPRKSGIKRQGEWFFIPVGKKENIHLNQVARKNPTRIKTERLGGTTHIARGVLTVGKTRYLRGYLTENRTGHHKSLFFPKWHRIMKNKETTIRVSKLQRDAALRRTRTFD